jgi:sterol desaturase/sphingolipid hydroxylase (fatty acid hydroxylase superfamily)
MAAGVDQHISLIEQLGQFWRHQALAIFAAPGSSLSVPALLLTLITATMAVLMARRSGKATRLRALVRGIFPRHIWRSPSGKADIGWFLFSLLGGGLMIGWALVAANTVSDWTSTALSSAMGPVSPVNLPGACVAILSTVLLFLAYEFAYWLDHCLMHRFDWSWEIHKVHHSADTLSLLTIFRVHPLETIGFYNLVALAMGITGGVLHFVFGPAATPLTLGGTNAIMLVSAILIVHLQHSHLWIHYGPVWGRLILGPAHHQIHHSSDPRHFNRNFGNVLTVFDRLFGTFHMPLAKRENLQFGAGDGAPHPHSLAAMTVTPIIAATRKAFPLPGIVPRSADAGERA